LPDEQAQRGQRRISVQSDPWLLGDIGQVTGIKGHPTNAAPPVGISSKQRATLHYGIQLIKKLTCQTYFVLQ
jgi:hypothetical protein